MQLVRIHHAVEQPPAGIRELRIHVQPAHSLPVGECGEITIYRVNDGHNGHVVVPRKDGRKDDRRGGGLRSHHAQDCLHAGRNVRNLRRRFALAGQRDVADVVGSGEQDDDFRIHSIQLSIVQSPKNILNFIGAPAEISRIPAVEVLIPVGQQSGIIGCAPAPGYGVTLEVDIDGALPGFLQKLVMRRGRVRIGHRRASG